LYGLVSLCHLHHWQVNFHYMVIFIAKIHQNTFGGLAAPGHVGEQALRKPLAAAKGKRGRWRDGKGRDGKGREERKRKEEKRSGKYRRKNWLNCLHQHGVGVSGHYGFYDIPRNGEAFERLSDRACRGVEGKLKAWPMVAHGTLHLNFG